MSSPVTAVPVEPVSPAAAPPIPNPRGPISRWVAARLAGQPTVVPPPSVVGDPLVDGDLHLALHCLFELEFRGFSDVSSSQVDDPLLRELRRTLEEEFLDALRADIEADSGDSWTELARVAGAGWAVEHLLDRFDGPSLSRFMASEGTAAHFREFMVHRSAYQLKEADPHTLGLARLWPGRRKSAFVQIQFDEYGNGEPGQSHAELFAAAMAGAGLDTRYGYYTDRLPGETLATGNLLSLLACRRDLLAPLMGHLALFEMTSVEPMGRYAAAARLLGFPPAVAHFYDVHVVADEHHGRLARDILLGDSAIGVDPDGLDPAEVVWGAHALLRTEDRFARSLLRAWEEDSIPPPRTAARR